MKKNRSTLKDYFKKGAIATEANFADLIDSMLNQEEDGISKLPDEPLKIIATGTDEALLNFYRIEKKQEKLSWQVKQKADGKTGLHVSDSAASRLFIEGDTGNIGIGTTAPTTKLDVWGRLSVRDFPQDDKTSALTVISLVTRAKGGSELSWSLMTAPIGGGWGVGPNSFEIWEYPATKPRLQIQAGGNTVLAPVEGNVGIGVNPNANAKLEVIGVVNFHDGGGLAVQSAFMSSGSLTIGSINKDYGGGSGWNPNTAGLLLEAKDRTEIAVHDGGTRVSSLMFYEGADVNRITIGRDMGPGWGAISSLILHGNIGIGTLTLHNPQGWNKVVDILGTGSARLNIRSSGGVVTSMFSHDDWGGPRAAFGTDSNHPLTFVTNYAHRMTVDASGKVGINTLTPIARLDIQDEARTDTHPSAVRGLYVTGSFQPDSDGVEFRHFNGSQGIGFGYNTIYATGAIANQDLGLKARGTGKVVVTGSLLQVVGGALMPTAGNSESTGLLFPPDAGGGGGDRAWMRYYARSGEAMTLELGTSNDADDHIALMPSGNVGIGTNAPSAKLEVVGDFIRKVAMVTGLGPGDPTRNGQIKSRTLAFTKRYAATAIRILYCDNLRVNGTDAYVRWEIRIDGRTAPGGGLYADKYGSLGNYHEPATILGYATGVSAGAHEIQIWTGQVPGAPPPGDAYTGWPDSRWTIEAQEVWL